MKKMFISSIPIKYLTWQYILSILHQMFKMHAVNDDVIRCHTLKPNNDGSLYFFCKIVLRTAVAAKLKAAIPGLIRILPSYPELLKRSCGSAVEVCVKRARYMGLTATADDGATASANKGSDVHLVSSSGMLRV